MATPLIRGSAYLAKDFDPKTGKFRKRLTHDEIELQRASYLADCRRDARRQMSVVAILLTCIASLVLGLAYHLLTR